MRILFIGLLVFFAWSILATYIYVCKIKGLCYDRVIMQTEVVKPDTLTKPVPKQVVLPESIIIYFAFDKSDFMADSASNKYLDDSKAYLLQNEQASLSITGYTDAIGTKDYNQQLGYRRAQRMQQYFESNGMIANKISIESKGENEPADNNTTVSGRANNRRSTITIKK